MTARALREAMEERARELGFSLVGVTTPEPSDHMDFYRSWLEADYHGDMAYLAREDAFARRSDPTRTMPEAASVVLVAHEYFQEDPQGVPDDASKAVISRYARGRDYHRVVKNKLLELLRWLDGRVERGVVGRAYVDTGPILERELSWRAGLGWFGKNTMLIHPRRGSYFFLGVLLVDIELPADEPFAEDHCGTCRACLDACPTGALLGRDEDGGSIMDARRCISYLTIEHRGEIPLELRRPMGNRVYGCDICQEVCPFNVRFARVAEEPEYAARPWRAPSRDDPPDAAGGPEAESPSLVDLLEIALHEASWDAHTRGSAVRRAGRAGLARNVCVALGNWASPDAVPVLSRALADPEPLVRGHAAWALGRVGTRRARTAVESALNAERDPFARREMKRAVAESGV